MWPAGVLAVALVLAPEDQVNDAGSEIEDRVQQGLDAAGDAIADAGDAIQDATRSAYEQVADGVSSSRNDIQAAADEAGEEAQTAVRGATAQDGGVMIGPRPPGTRRSRSGGGVGGDHRGARRRRGQDPGRAGRALVRQFRRPR